MELTIVLDNIERIALEKISSDNGIAPSEYAQNIVSGFLKNQIIGAYKIEFRKKTIPELVQLFGNIIQ